MEPKCKKREVTEENRKFNNDWSLKYFFIEFNGGATCLVCRDSVSVFKDNKVKRPYERQYSAKYGAFRLKNEQEKTAVFDWLKEKFFSENVGKCFPSQNHENSKFIGSLKLGDLHLKNYQAQFENHFEK